MANLFIRTYTFVDGTTAYGSQVEAEIGNIVTVLNNLNTAATTWGIVSSAHATSVPLIADCSSGSQHIADFKNNSVIKASISSTGLLTCVGITNSGAAIAAGSQKITGLSNGTAATDAAAFGQLKVLQVVTATNTSNTDTTSSTFANTGLAASITPTSSSNRILVIVSGMIAVSGSAVAEAVTVKRGSTNVFGNTYGWGYSRITVAGLTSSQRVFCGAVIDSPATTSSTTYTVAILSNDNASTVSWGIDSNATQTIILMEVV